MGLVPRTVGHSICHPVSILNTHCSRSKACPQSDCGVLERRLISFVMIQDIWLRVIKEGDSSNDCQPLLFCDQKQIHKTLE